MNNLKWINKPKIPAIYKCPKCGESIGFTSRCIYARRIYGRLGSSKYYLIDSKIHKCRITKDYKKELEKHE